MSKSIYERVLDLRNRISLDGDDTIYEEDYLLLDEVLDLIENIGGVKKQEKLLELYRELMTVKDESISLLFIGNYNNDMEEMETKLERQIKELENDNT